MIFFLIYKSKKPLFFSFSSWLIKASVLHTRLMKLLPIYKNILRVCTTVLLPFNLVKPLKSLRTGRLFQLKPVFYVYSFLAKWNYQSISQSTERSPPDHLTLFLGEGCVCYSLSFSFWQYRQDLIAVISGFSLPTACFWCQGNIQSFESYFLF